jgi:hypothetical protein
MTTRRESTYKQTQFETAVRNPERYKNILSLIKEYEGSVLDDEKLLEIVVRLYLEGEFTSKDIVVSEQSTDIDIRDNVIKVNSTRKADGGFPQGYASRFWTYMRTPSELGLIYTRYNKPLKVSEITKMLIKDEIDEQEAFSIQAVRYNRRSPYKNVSNDYNFFKLTIETLLERGGRMSYEQFMVLMFNKTGNPKETLEILEGNTFKDAQSVFNFVKEHYDATTKINTITKDYPDVTIRIMVLCGFVRIRYEGKKLIEINQSKLNYTKELLEIPFNLNEAEKEDAEKYFEKLNENNEKYLEIVKKYREEDVLDGQEYTNKIYNIITLYDITEDKIINDLKKINDGTKSSISPEFDEIYLPLRLEFYISILVALKYKGELFVRPNYKADHTGKPYSHAPGNKGDIDVYSKETYWLIEVTLIRNKTQQLNSETTSLIRHFDENIEFGSKPLKYLSFVAPTVHTDTQNFINTSLVQVQVENKGISIKPYDIASFVDTTKKKNNFDDMVKYSNDVFKDFKERLANT